MSLDGDVAKLSEFYDGWASTYDSDVGDHGYGLPASMVSTLQSAIDALQSEGQEVARFNRDTTTVMDAGCGTGQVGQALAESGFRTIDGVDLSKEMIEVASATGVYRHLESGIDLTIPPPEHLTRSADVVAVGGVFTVGHVPPTALAPIAKLAKPNGLLIVSTRHAYQEEADYETISDQFAADGLFRLVCRHRSLPYTMDSVGDFWAYQVNGPTV